jgi:geranylgeranyl diphosphate synthase type II
MGCCSDRPDITAFLHEKALATEDALAAHVNAWEADAPPTLIAAMRYSLFAGGKRLRPALALGAAEIISGDSASAMPVACALEMIHTYSLIHDDLPAMDDDDIRRGRPTLHKAHGEAIAILAGDALLTNAFEVAAETGNARIVAELAVAAGVCGMVSGQVLDITAEGRQITLDDLRQIHRRKTGALIRAAVRLGAIAAGADQSQLDALTAYGEAIGLTFQIADDILNVVGEAEAMGKAVGSDAARDKSTYPALLGLDEALRLGAQGVENALEALAPFGSEADLFRALARYVMDRDR